MNLKIYLLLIFFTQLFVSCGNSINSGNNNDEPVIGRTGNVTFSNESSYDIKIHRNSFSGPVLLELPANSSPKTIPVGISDNNGVGTVFSIEYLYQINEGFDTDSGKVIASGTDPNLQLIYEIEENKSYTVQIPNPINPEFKTAFIKILNEYNLPCELTYYGRTLVQNNGNSPIPPGKTGIYKESVSVNGELYDGFIVVAVSESTPVPEFTIKNGFIYSCRFNGTSVTKPEEEKIIWRN